MIPFPVDGQTRIENGAGITTVSAVFDTSPEDLWEAITLPERVARWFGKVSLRAGGTSIYDAALVTGWAGTVTVLECEAPRLIRVSLLDDEPTATIVVATLEATGEGTRLTIEERGLPIGDLLLYVAGWHAQLDMLHADLTGGPVGEWQARWDHLRATYLGQ